METNAPNHKIGTGSLEVKPEMQAVHDEFKKVEETIKGLEELAGKMLDPLLAKIKQAKEGIQDITIAMAELKAPDFSNPPLGREPERKDAPRPAIPERDSPEAQQILDRAEQDRDRQEAYQNIREINLKLDSIVIELAKE